MAKSFIANVSSLGGARLFLTASQVLILPLVARHVSATEFGALAIAMSVVMLAQVVSDGGLGRALIRQPEIDDQEWSTIFWFLFILGLGLTVVILALAVLLDTFYDTENVPEFIAWLSILPILSSVTAIPTARLEREERFALISSVRIGSGIVALAITILMILNGFGVWSLIVQQIVLAVGQMILIFAASSFRPHPTFLTTYIRKHLNFSLETIGVSLVFTLQRQAPVFLIGSIIGVGAAGIFSMSRRFLNLPNLAIAAPASQVIYVKMAAAQPNKESVLELYFSAMRILGIALFPPFAILAGSGFHLFPIFLSDKWSEVGLIFALATPGFLIEAAISPGGVFFQALGATKLRLRMAIERAVLRTAFIIPAVFISLSATAIAISIFSLIYMFRYWQYMQMVHHFRLLRALSTLVASALTSVVVFIFAWLIDPALSDLFYLSIVVSLVLLGWGFACLLQWRALSHALGHVGQTRRL